MKIIILSILLLVPFMNGCIDDTISETPESEAVPSHGVLLNVLLGVRNPF